LFSDRFFFLGTLPAGGLSQAVTMIRSRAARTSDKIFSGTKWPPAVATPESYRGNRKNKRVLGQNKKPCNGVTEEKIESAPLGELVRAAAKSPEVAGNMSPVSMDGFILIQERYGIVPMNAPEPAVILTHATQTIDGQENGFDQEEPKKD